MNSSIKIQNASVSFKVYKNKNLSLKDFFARNAAISKLEKDDYFDALNDISLKINPGERVGIIGKNGAGKSTLLKLICGIYPPSSGDVAISGTVASLIELGAGFHQEFTGRENLYLNGAILGMAEKQIQLIEEEVIQFSELQSFIDTPIKYYSSGMYMRLAFSLATALHPDILILDEIFAAGDIGFVEKARARMNKMVEDANIFLMVSHDMDLMNELSNRVIWIDSGKIMEDGSPSEVINCFKRFIK
ncbi:ABC transporter ATP-binding protein [Polynucleobacter paneuropaeus]|jgi:ABC-type polysaccharide/polyol phosphate transport system ATPase subunit|nr:ABC transporter ATP-binding protein [Polynucleobacter paneuropaeus]